MAQRFPPAWLDELRAGADIVQTVQAYVPLKRNGNRYWGLCPLHGEKTASFSVDPEKQLFYCFGCKAGGSVIQFLMDMERISFSDAVKLLAERQHVPLPQMVSDPDWQRKQSQRERLLECNREAARFFHQQLFQPSGEPVLKYLKGRGVDDAVIRKFGLGAAPQEWDALTREMMGRGYTLQELRLAGVTVVKPAETMPDGSVKPQRAFDMFRSRAMFPIIDQYGNVLAFGGRMLEKGQPKYLNTSDTPVFNKRLGVYAANLLRKERNLNRVVLVEGYMDVVSLTQFGVKGVCATLGTALTPQQAKLLRRFAPMVYLGYDGDSAGQHAILRGLDILQAQGIPARVLDFPDGLDPDEFIRRDGPQGFDSLPALTPAAYRMRRLKDDYDLSTQEGRTEYAKACAPILARLQPVEMENHLQQLMVQTGFTREVLSAQIGLNHVQQQREKVSAPTALVQRPAGGIRPTVKQPVDDDLRSQQVLISVLATGRLPKDIVSEEDFDDAFLRTICGMLLGGASAAAVAESMQEPNDRARASRLLLSTIGQDTNQLITMAEDCLNTIRKRHVSNRITELLKQSETLGQKEKKAVMDEVMRLTQELRQLKSRKT